MSPASLDTVNFCLKFIQENFDEASQRTMCRTWLKTAIDTINSEGLGSADFITAELNAIDQYLSGASTSLTSVDVLTKLDTAKQLLG